MINLLRKNYDHFYYTKEKKQTLFIEMLDRIDITAKFYDSNDNYLDSKSTSKRNLANSYIWDCTITYYSDSYFENIDKVKFEFEVS